MVLFYNLSVLFYLLAIRIAAVCGNVKAQNWLAGRKNIFSRIQQSVMQDERCVWFHCASLGEFEQGRPVIEKFRAQYPACKIVLTFFSPSGYEIRKNYAGADYIFYLPLDTRSNARKFISLIHPEMVFFVKYEYWFHYFNELGGRKIPVYLISAIFRPDHRFFKWYGGFFRRMLKQVAHFFVQDDSSAVLLNSIGHENCTVTGDTRFDRVAEVASNAKPVSLVEKFKAGKKIFIAGSTWEKDEQLLIGILAELRTYNCKLIIAPHEINEKRINDLVKAFAGFGIVKFSEANKENVADAEILVIDNIGMLSSLYQYGSFAYIGGGFGSGIHNILEAAVFGMPVFFGPNYRKFNEAVEMINLGAAFSVTGAQNLISGIKILLQDENKLRESSTIAIQYVVERKGATDKIIDLLSPL